MMTIGLAETIESLTGGSDEINTGDGDDFIFGGIDADTINVGNGNNVVLGDSGYIDWTAAENWIKADAWTRGEIWSGVEISNGAEVDRVYTELNHEAGTLSGDDDRVRRDIEGVVAEAKRAGGVLVKVILETCYLTPDQIARACEIARDAGADYVKTSTGFGDGPATPEAVDVMVRTVGDTMGVKASGGVRSYETACGYLDQGCKRLGSAGGTPAIVEEAPP